MMGIKIFLNNSIKDFTTHVVISQEINTSRVVNASLENICHYLTSTQSAQDNDMPVHKGTQ